MKYFLVFFLFSSLAQAYTLNNNFGASFKKNKVGVQIANTSNCAQAGLSPTALRDLIEPAVDRFWNQVPTSALKLSDDGFSETIPHITDGVLCAPTDSSCISSAGTDLIPGVTDIIISCNTNAANFSSNNVLAVTIPNNFSGKKIAGAVILINDTSPIFSTLSKSDQISVIAHEIGHAIGLGHAEDKEKSALMYYKTVNLRRSLGQDDMDGVSYLYPVHFDAFGKGCFGAMIDTDSGSIPPSFWQLALGFLIIALIMQLKKLARLFKRPNTRSPA